MWWTYSKRLHSTSNFFGILLPKRLNRFPSDDDSPSLKTVIINFLRHVHWFSFAMWDTFMTLTEIYWKLSNNVMTNNFEDERRNVEADAVTTVRQTGGAYIACATVLPCRPFAKRTRKPSLEVTPTTLAQRTRTNTQNTALLTSRCNVHP